MSPASFVDTERFCTVRLPLQKRDLWAEWSCNGHGRITESILAHTMHDTPSTNAINILLVEDNPGDVRLTQEAFKTADQEIALRIATNGGNAIEFLMQESPDDPLPDLVLLDLNLPGRDGCDVLEEIRDDSQLKPLPVIMLTSSDADEDISRCYDARANAYLTKPTNPAEFSSLAEKLGQFWFEQALLPSIPQ